jgi:hypothetical protein
MQKHPMIFSRLRERIRNILLRGAETTLPQLMEAELFDDAILLCRRIVSQRPDAWGVHAILLDALYRMGRYHDCVGHAQSIIDNAPAVDTLMVPVCYALYALDRFQDVLDSKRRDPKLFEHSNELGYVYASSLFSLSQFSAVADFLRSAQPLLQSELLGPRSLYLLASSIYKMGDQQGCITVLDELPGSVGEDAELVRQIEVLRQQVAN